MQSESVRAFMLASLIVKSLTILDISKSVDKDIEHGYSLASLGISENFVSFKHMPGGGAEKVWWGSSPSQTQFIFNTSP